VKAVSDLLRLWGALRAVQRSIHLSEKGESASQQLG
jgi:hypothetical protein